MTEGLLQTRIVPPRAAERVVSRPRLVRLINELCGSYPIVRVTGSAGAGKTTAVIEAVTAGTRPVAWHTLDASDAAPGRLLTYLEESLVRVARGLPRAATRALAAKVPQTEAAGLLAEAAGAEPVTLVLDELERIAGSESACGVVSAFLRYAPSSMRVILVSRRPIALDLGSAKELGGVGAVDEVDLAFTVEEAAEALALMGGAPDDAPSVVDATRGWVAGVLFEAWRSEGHVYGAGGEVDPLSGYLSREIMAHLPEDGRTLLIETALLDVVTSERAEGLGVERAGDVMAALRAYRLPASFVGDGSTLRCHPRFREYLQEQLCQRNPVRVRELRAAYATLLSAEGRHEEAVERLLDVGDLSRAAAEAELAIPEVIRRMDFAVAARWLTAIPREAVEGSSVLTSAELVVALEHEEYSRGAACADRLLGSPSVVGVTLAPDIGCSIAWCYYLVVRIEDARAVLERTEPGTQVEAMRFALGVDMVDDPIRYEDRPANTGERIDGLLTKVDYSHGRFTRVLDEPTRAWSAVRTSRVGALHALGRLDEALESITNDRELDEVTSFRVVTELLADLGRFEEAHAAALRGRARVRRAGSGLSTPLGCQMEAMLALRSSVDLDAADELLDEVDRAPITQRHLRILEQQHVCRGLQRLLEGRDSVAAEHLRAAVELMTSWDRLLSLPEAAVFLAEAEWRLGNEDRADAAADIALGAAARQRSNHRLLRALRMFPGVISRRLDAEPGSDSAWHALGRAMMADGLLATQNAGERMHLREFGDPVLLVDGKPVAVRLSKSLELLAYLVIADKPVTREELLDALFASRTDDSARSYLRQALNALRRVMTDDHELMILGDNTVVLGGAGITADSLEFERRARQAALQQGAERVAAGLDAVELFERGEYFAGSASEWVSARREAVRALANDTRHMTAEAAFAISRLAEAERLTRRVLADDAYRESTWRLSMRIAAALGDDDRAISRYRGCADALRLLGVEPADSTRELLRALRR